jgi:hypothetical protein
VLFVMTKVFQYRVYYIFVRIRFIGE